MLKSIAVTGMMCCLLGACVPGTGGPAASLAASGLSQGLQLLREGRFATALAQFQSMNVFATENLTGLMGLAIAADMEGRFALAARAYKALEGRGSDQAIYLNNLGYSYMLRGQLPLAYTYLKQAQARDPNNQTIAGNLEMLNAVLAPEKT